MYPLVRITLWYKALGFIKAVLHVFILSLQTWKSLLEFVEFFTRQNIKVTYQEGKTRREGKTKLVPLMNDHSSTHSS